MTMTRSLSQLWSWLLGPAPKPLPEAPALEEFGNVRLPASFGEELLAETPSRARSRTAIRDLIGDLARDRKRELVDRILLRFALWVVDLPASEAHHDSSPGGHLDHALRVAHSVTQALSNSTLRLSHDPVEDARERPRWIYAGFVSALFHDAGKLFDLEVQAPDGKELWNPQAEPLAAFLGRYGLRRTPKDLIRFHPGRGLKAHKAKGRVFQPLILPPEATSYAGRRLLLATEAYAESGQGELPPHLPDAARGIAGLIRTWDKEESILSRVEEQATAGLAPAESPPPSPVQATPPSPAVAVPAVQPAERPPGVIPGEELWGMSRYAAGRSLSADRLHYVLGRLVESGRLSSRGDSAQVFIRPDFIWFASPIAFERVADLEQFKWRSDLQHKMLLLLAKSGSLKPFGPERYVAEVRSVPDSNSTKKVFRLATPSVLNEPSLAALGMWPHEPEVVRGAEREISPGEPAA